jgi:hypothetical protein
MMYFTEFVGLVQLTMRYLAINVGLRDIKFEPVVFCVSTRYCIYRPWLLNDTRIKIYITRTFWNHPEYYLNKNGLQG